eukprot:TRINITY_DN11869_c4_g3_i1.p1 TRINITY_DN11869_c4_g3~~TRINITY_DN11869_c4_g3_i1.p1  ORF type:complete len:210 (+),score=37.40 TRINITY_DN11869_c4_g3_i1:118-747(+)
MMETILNGMYALWSNGAILGQNSKASAKKQVHERLTLACIRNERDVILEQLSARRWSSSDVKRFLHQYRADLGMTLLMLCATENHVEAGEALLQLGSNVNAQDIDGNTALHVAMEFQHGAMVELLLANQASADLRNSRGDSGLTLLTHARNSELEQAYHRGLYKQALRLVEMLRLALALTDHDKADIPDAHVIELVQAAVYNLLASVTP